MSGARPNDAGPAPRRLLRGRVPPRSPRAIPILLTGLALATLVPGCFGPRFDRGAMLETIGTTVILPAHEAFVAEAARLDSVARAFASDPTEPGLLALRDEWLRANLAWRGVHLFQVEGLLLLHNAIEKRPARADFIEGAIAERSTGAGGALDAAFIEGSGATSKGLGAIEYLLFPGGASSVGGAPPAVAPSPADVVRAFRTPARAEYLTALTANLSSKATELRDFWTPAGGNHLRTFAENDSDGADIQGSVSLLSNRMIELFEMATRDWIGRPTGRTTDGTPRAEDVEAPLGGRSLELAIASVESLRRTFGAGLDDYLRHLDRSGGETPLADRIDAQFDVVLAALRAIEPPLERAVLEDPIRTGAAYDAMRAMVVLLKTEMSAQLGITVTFSDNDGD